MAKKKKPHEHNWIFDGQSCCYRMKCSRPNCIAMTTAHRIKGRKPQIGDPVRLLDDGDTIEVIGSQIQKDL